MCLPFHVEHSGQGYLLQFVTKGINKIYNDGQDRIITHNSLRIPEITSKTWHVPRLRCVLGPTDTLASALDDSAASAA